MRLKEIVAIVTGGGGYVGTATCNKLAGEGAIVFVNDLYENNCTKLSGLHIVKSLKRGFILDCVFCRNVSIIMWKARWFKVGYEKIKQTLSPCY